MEVDADTLSCEDGQLYFKDVVKGSNLFYQQMGSKNAYPVTVFEKPLLISTETQRQVSKRKRDEVDILINGKHDVSLLGNLQFVLLPTEEKQIQKERTFGMLCCHRQTNTDCQYLQKQYFVNTV